VNDQATLVAGMAIVPAWKLRRAAEILDRDGDEHGVAADLWAMLADRGSQAKQQPEQKPSAWMTEAPDGSPMLWPTREEAASYCGEDESPVALYAEPPAASAPASQPLTEAQIVAAARALKARTAIACNISEDDCWNLYAEDFKADVKAVMEAAGFGDAA
jgi:hypothetical protein